MKMSKEVISPRDEDNTSQDEYKRDKPDNVNVDFVDEKYICCWKKIRKFSLAAVFHQKAAFRSKIWSESNQREESSSYPIITKKIYL